MRDRTMFGNKAGNSIDRRAFNDTEILFKTGAAALFFQRAPRDEDLHRFKRAASLWLARRSTGGAAISRNPPNWQAASSSMSCSLSANRRYRRATPRITFAQLDRAVVEPARIGGKSVWPLAVGPR